MSLNNDRSSCVYAESIMKEKITLILSKDIQNQINLLHNQIGREEWSGILLYKVVEGNISEPESLVLRADYIYPMDIGTSTYTEFDYGESYVEMYDKLPIIENNERVYKIGTIHTHHSMSTFFSGTDTGELHTNSSKHNFYLSLIVNFEVKPIAKVAVFSSEGETIYKFKGHKLNETYERVVPNRGALLIYDCDIEFECPDWFLEKLEQLKAKRKARPVHNPPLSGISYPSYPNYGEQSYIFDESHLDKKRTKGGKKKNQSDIEQENLNTYMFQPMSSLCASITGNINEYSDIYNVLKKVYNDYESQENHNKTEYLFNFQNRVSKNFEIVCSSHKKRKVGKYELDEFAERTLKVLDTYKFDSKFDPIINSLKLSLEKFIVDVTANR